MRMVLLLERINKAYLFLFCCFCLQEAHAMQEKVSAQYKNEIEMAKAQRDYELKKAAYDVEVNSKKAESEMAYQLQVQSHVQGHSSSIMAGLGQHVPISSIHILSHIWL